MRTDLVLSAAFAALSLVASVPLADRPLGYFSLEAKPKLQERRDFMGDWKAAHNRWGKKKAVSDFRMAFEGEGTVQAKPLIKDQAYVTEVDFGTPAQKLKMILDTGSSDVWVQSSDTIYRVNENGPWAPRYFPNNSSTSSRVDEAIWGVRYLDGTTAAGIVYRDTLRLGGLEIKHVAIESAEIMAPRFESETGVSGIMGLAKQLPNNITPPTPSFLSLIRSHLKEPVFTVDLRRNASSRFEFGHINESVPADNITWLESDPNSPHWDIKLDLTAWRGKNPMWMYHEFQATVDTGTSLLFLPEPLVSRYWVDVPGVKKSDLLSGVYEFPCEGAQGLPDLLFKLPKTEHVIRIPGPYLNYGPLNKDPSLCWGGLQSSEGLDATVLGDVMLKAIFVAFDIEKNRVGLANKILYDV
ncbi:endothiapepsin-like protein [Metarhizium rileyi]|uniref:Endothiapepsin-like protein n=1 Tax=Metarhizium rileyi (strain RCEF 4871) TaxID=1649241 RepID=A0A167G911_METRR|nr:endothiapepsin-like protein [Metarhizium rileyi RCEF 4871]